MHGSDIEVVNIISSNNQDDLTWLMEKKHDVISLNLLGIYGCLEIFEIITFCSRGLKRIQNV